LNSFVGNNIGLVPKTVQSLRRLKDEILEGHDKVALVMIIKNTICLSKIPLVSSCFYSSTGQLTSWPIT